MSDASSLHPDDEAPIDTSVVRELRSRAVAESHRLRAEAIADHALETDDDELMSEEEARALCRALRGGKDPVVDGPQPKVRAVQADDMLSASIRRGIITGRRLS